MVDWIVPDWSAPPRVRALVTTRAGGVSEGAYASLNLGAHVGDDPRRVAANRALLRESLPGEPLWMNQVHGITVVRADVAEPGCIGDGAVTSSSGVVCAVMTADCLPVLLCTRDGTIVAAAHAGWRGLAQGIIEATVAEIGVPGNDILAWLGPAIGARSYEVGDEVRLAFVESDVGAGSAFTDAAPGKWWCDLYALARRRLANCGVMAVCGGGFDTCAEPDRFYSYRRDGQTGRLASLIWLAE